MTLLEYQCLAAQIPTPVAEHRFAPPRRWRFDYYWPDARVALEVEGGVFIRGRHSRGVGMVKDMEKYNTAAVLGIRVIRCTPKQVEDGTAFAWVKKAISTS